jgi:hypothetical protein
MEAVMSNNFEAAISIEEYSEDDDFGPDDFTFVLGPDGELKSFIIPEHLMDDPPEEVQLILNFFGIESIYDLENRTLH